MKVMFDGRPFVFEGSKTVLEAAREAGVPIPHLCDHPELKPFGGCRMCVVEIKGRRGFPPSCCTPAEDGMEVMTQTPEVQALRRGILELILSEHPFACLICAEYGNCLEKKSTIRKVSEVTGCILCSNDKRCELQDTVRAVGADKIPFPAFYRNVDVHREDPFFDRDYNLCILCGRCVRVCEEVRGASTVAFTERGSESLVGTAFGRPLTQAGCQFCGACVDVCPTGALVERAARPDVVPDRWGETICPLCSSGCRLRVGLKDGSVITVKPDERGPANHGQACVRGRFLIREIAAARARRILKPHARKGGELVEVGWDEALDVAAEKLKGAAGGASALITSPQVGLEDLFAAYRFGREILETDRIAGAESLSGIEALASFLKKNELGSDFAVSENDIARSGAFLVCGEALNINQPMVWIRIHEAIGRGAKLILLDSEETALDRHAAVSLRTAPGRSAAVLGFLCRLILQSRKTTGFDRGTGFKEFQTSLKALPESSEDGAGGVGLEALEAAAAILGSAREPLFFFGPSFAREDGSSALAALWNLAALTGAHLAPTIQEGNARAEFELRRCLGFVEGSLGEILKSFGGDGVRALYLAGPAPRVDRSGLEALIVQDSFWSENAEQADVVLPAATFLETEGTFINMEGRFQRHVRVVDPAGESKPDWEILAGLARRLKPNAAAFSDFRALSLEAERSVEAFRGISGPEPLAGREFKKEDKEKKKAGVKFVPLALDPPHGAGEDGSLRLTLSHSLDYYRSFVFSREVKGLRALRDSAWVLVHPEEAAALGIKDGDRIVLEADSGSLIGVAHLSESVGRGTLRASLILPGASGLDLWSRAPVPVRLRKG